MQIIKSIQSRIYIIRDERVMLDFDLASFYEVETKVLNKAVKRNVQRFPEDFMFQLTPDEWQNVAMKNEKINSSFAGNMNRSQIVTGSQNIEAIYLMPLLSKV